MSATRNVYRGLRLPPGLALAMLSALLVFSQIATVAHADTDCEHDTCGLCIGWASESALVDNPALQVTPRCKRPVESLVSTSVHSACPPIAQFIRAPPAH